MNAILEETQIIISEIQERLNQNEILSEEDIMNLLCINLIREEIGIQE